MKAVLRFMVVFILTGLIFQITFSNSIRFSIDPIIGSIYDHAKPETRENTIKNIKEMCDGLNMISERPDITVEIDPSINKEELTKICQKNLEGRQFFIEFFKAQTGDFQDIISKNTGMAKYSKLLNLGPKNTLISIILIIFLTILLFPIEGNYLDFLKTINRILLMVSVCLVFTYFLPKIIGYFIDIDTSFLMEHDNSSVRIIGPLEIILVLLPIILDEIFTSSLLVYGGCMFGLYLVILAFLHAKSNKLITVNNNSTEGPGPITTKNCG